MPEWKKWSYQDEQDLIKFYSTMTIHELEKFLNKSADSINSKVRRLKERGKIVGYKEKGTKKRAFSQRSRSWRINNKEDSDI
jgi:DNA-binding transcriptional regulator GbsR (MarR family)